MLRPGRFDRSIYFDLPTRAGRRDIIDYYLTKKAHDEELDDPDRRESLASITAGYSPVMIEHLFDEALIWALRRGADRLDWSDLTKAKMTDEIGLAAETIYTDEERNMIATHEAGHATVAWLVGKGRKLDVLSIVRRKGALGLLAHSEVEERFTKTRSELNALIQIAMGGMVAEEVFFGQSSSGVAGDLKAATDSACQMVGALGMGSTLISAVSLEVPGAGNLATKVLSTDAGRDEVEAVLRSAKAKVRTMVEANRATLEALRDALLQRNELIGDEILEVIEGAQVASTTVRVRPSDFGAGLSAALRADVALVLAPTWASARPPIRPPSARTPERPARSEPYPPVPLRSRLGLARERADRLSRPQRSSVRFGSARASQPIAILRLCCRQSSGHWEPLPRP